MRRRVIWVAGVAVTAALGLTLASTGTATAATALPDRTVLTSSSPNDYTFSTTTRGWSVVGLQPASGVNYDLRLFTSGGTALDKSLLGNDQTDFVAINSHSSHRDLGGYRANVRLASGTGAYAVQLRKTPTIVTLPIPAWDGVAGPGDPDITFATLPDADVVALYEIKLNAGDRFWASSTTAAGRLYLVESIPDATTWIQSRAEAGTANTKVVDGCTLYTATMSNWHALVVVGDRSPADTGGGLGYALHRADPAKLSTCPIRSFPGPTPA
jgi:hypothetical protein